MKQIFEQIVASNTVKEVTDILMSITEDYSVSWLPVGGRQDNIATINIGTDPAAGLTERITNAIDAVLDLEWHKQGKPADISSPRNAVESWFKIKEGKLRNIKRSDFDKEITDLARKVKVTLRDSERENNPSVEIRDAGIGIRPEDFSKTILSLHGGNKLKKLFLMGAYGQGGSTALSYNNYTIIISKPFYIDKKEKPFVSWTIVRINQGDVNTDKHEWFEYLIDKKTGNPLTLEIPDSKFEPGTLVRHIAMDLSKYKGAITQLTGSLWYLSHNYLFDTVLPFTISDERKKIKQIENRSVLGNNRRLTTGETTEYKREVPLTFKDGKVIIYYWVLSQEGTDNPKERITQYTLASQPVVITFNGQKQGTLSNSIIKNELKLPFLERYLIVQIECDKLDNESKRQLFSSTRETLRDTSLLDELKKLTVDTLSADDDLKVLDRQRKERYLKRTDTDTNDILRKRLANKINVYLKNMGTGNAVRATETKETVKNKKQPPIPVSEPPTFLEITSLGPKEVFIGKTFSIKFKTDAHPNYFFNPDVFLAFIEPHSFGSFTGTASVVDGYGIAYFTVREDVFEGDEGRITLELRPPRQKSISTGIDITASIAEEDANKNKNGEKNIPNIEIHEIDQTNPFYKENQWTPQSVSRVDIASDCVHIWINVENRHLIKLIEKAQKHGTDAVSAIKQKYIEHVSFCSFMINQNKIDETVKIADPQISPEVIEMIKQADLLNASESISGIISDFFESIIIENVEA